MNALTVKHLDHLGSDHFEALVAALVMKEHPGADHPGGQDEGADVILEHEDERPDIWQAKHYPRDIHWDKCEESLDRAVATSNPKSVTFVFPRKLSPKIKRTFRRRLAHRHPGVEVGHISGPQVLERIRLNPEIERQFFGDIAADVAAEVVSRMEARFGSALAGGDPMGARLQNALAAGSSDSVFRTEVTATLGDTPETTWDETPYMVLHEAGSDRGIRVAVWPRTGVELEHPAAVFLDSEDGRRALEDVREQLALGAEAEITRGFRIDLPRVPDAMATAFDQTLLEGGSLTIRSEQSHEVTIRTKWNDEPLERRVQVRALPPDVDGFVASFGGISSGVGIFIDVSLEPPNRVGMSIRVSLTLGGTMEENLEASEFVVALFEGSGTTESPGLMPPGRHKIPPLHIEPETALRARGALELYRALMTFRELLDVDLVVPDPVRGEQIMAASKAAKALRDGHGEMTLQMLRAEVLDDETEAFAERMRTESLARWPLGIEILGQPVSMGLVEATIPPPVIVVPTDETGTGGRILELRWPDGVLINVKFVDDQSDRGGVSRFLWTP